MAHRRSSALASFHREVKVQLVQVHQVERVARLGRLVGNRLLVESDRLGHVRVGIRAKQLGHLHARWRRTECSSSAVDSCRVANNPRGRREA